MHNSLGISCGCIFSLRNFIQESEEGMINLNLLYNHTGINGYFGFGVVSHALEPRKFIILNHKIQFHPSLGNNQSLSILSLKSDKHMKLYNQNSNFLHVGHRPIVNVPLQFNINDHYYYYYKLCNDDDDGNDFFLNYSSEDNAMNDHYIVSWM